MIIVDPTRLVVGNQGPDGLEEFGSGHLKFFDGL
jgi:hypothetical protein